MLCAHLSWRPVSREGRFYPVVIGSVRPYLGAGATVFAPDVAARGAVGAEVQFGSVQLFADAGYEHFFGANAAGVNWTADSLVLGAGAGGRF